MRWPGVLMLVIGTGGLAAAQGMTDFSFMPDGGRNTFVAVFKTASEARLVLAETHDAAEWAARIAAAAPELAPRQVETLAGYLAINTPLAVATDPEADAPDLPDITTLLAPDGRDLALAQCQFCHSLFSGYLTQDRDEIGWLSTFKSPFHSTIAMTEVEQRTFANYSAINMPMKYTDVPPELRF
ncbi:MAG: hypothetical protein Q8P60_14940 [Pseudorhodobacter sp.]|nr:hypothetical protein [Pseudorhodobacter sp.]